MVVLLGKELKVARKRIQELEEKQVPHIISSTNVYWAKPCIYADVIELTNRAERAETAMRILKKCAEDERVEKERYRQLANQCKKVRITAQPSRTSLTSWTDHTGPRWKYSPSITEQQSGAQCVGIPVTVANAEYQSDPRDGEIGYLEKKWVALNPCSVYRLKFPLGWKERRVGEIRRKVSWKVPKGTQSKTAIAGSKDYHPVPMQYLMKGLRDAMNNKNLKDASSQCQTCDGIVSGSGTTVCQLADSLSAFLLVSQCVRSVNPATCSTKGLALFRDI